MSFGNQSKASQVQSEESRRYTGKSHLAEFILNSFINNTSTLFAKGQPRLQNPDTLLVSSPIIHVMLNTVLVLPSIYSQTPMLAQREREHPCVLIQVRSFVTFSPDLPRLFLQCAYCKVPIEALRSCAFASTLSRRFGCWLGLGLGSGLFGSRA